MGKPYTPYKGSITVKCPLCDEDMWLPPACREKHEKEDIPAFCMMCILKHKGPAAFDSMQSLTDKKMGE